MDTGNLPNYETAEQVAADIIDMFSGGMDDMGNYSRYVRYFAETIKPRIPQNITPDSIFNAFMNIVKQDELEPLPKEIELVKSLFTTEADKSINTNMNESMINLHKQFIHGVTDDNYVKANEALEAIIEAKLRQKIQTSLKQVDEGLFDRLGAQAAGVGANWKAKAQNFGNRVSSSAKAIGQNIGGAVTGKGFSAGQKTVDTANKQIAANDPAKRKKAAQADSILASVKKDLQTLYPGVNVDKALTGLRMQLNLFKPKAAPVAKPSVAQANPGQQAGKYMHIQNP
jgi:hypothetical protein